MSETKVSTLSNKSETLLIPLYYCALKTQRPDAMIQDEKVVEMIKRLRSDGALRYEADWLKQTPISDVTCPRKRVLPHFM